MQNKNQEEAQVVPEGVADFGKGSFFVSPEKIIKIAGIKVGDRVADFGCGAGYFSLPAAKTVGETGEILAFDVLPSAIEALESRASTEGVDNITIKRVNLEKENGTGLEEESVDWVIIKDILFQNKNQISVFLTNIWLFSFNQILSFIMDPFIGRYVHPPHHPVKLLRRK